MAKSTSKSSSKAAKATTTSSKPKKAVAAPAASDSSSSDSEASSSGSGSESDSSSDSESEDESEKKAKADSSSSESESESESSSDSDSSDSDSDSDSDSGSDKKNDEASSASSDAGSSDNGKRKAEESDVEMEETSDAAAASTKKQKVDEPASMYVGNLPFSATKEQLIELFESYGEITDARIATAPDSNRSRGFGYVDFASTEARDKAIAAAGVTLEDRELRLDTADSKPRQNNSEGRKDFASSRAPNAPSNILFIGNLSFNSSDHSVREAFAECGEVTSVRLITDRDTGRMKGYGYIEFADIEGAKKAMEWNNTMLDGRSIRLDYSAPRNNESGGGRGGSRGGSRGGFRGGRGGGGFRGGRGGFRGGRNGY